MTAAFTPPQQLLWTEDGARRWDLYDNNIRYATLQWNKSFGSLATGESVDGRWTFKRCGFFRPYITVRIAGNEAIAAQQTRAGGTTSTSAEPDLAVMRSIGRGEAEIQFANGRKYYWRATKRRRRERGIYDQQGRLLVATLFERRFFTAKGSVTLETDAPGCTELSVLCLLAWHRLVLEDSDEQDAMAGAVVAVMG